MRVVMLMIVALAGATIGGAMLWVGFAARGGRLQPGHRLGIRTAATARSDVAWYAAHRAASWPIILGGVASLLTGLGVGAVRPSTDFALSFMLLPFAPVALASAIASIVANDAAIGADDAAEDDAAEEDTPPVAVDGDVDADPKLLGDEESGVGPTAVEPEVSIDLRDAEGQPDEVRHVAPVLLNLVGARVDRDSSVLGTQPEADDPVRVEEAGHPPVE